jgi:hypothetical protein
MEPLVTRLPTQTGPGYSTTRVFHNPHRLGKVFRTQVRGLARAYQKSRNIPIAISADIRPKAGCLAFLPEEEAASALPLQAVAEVLPLYQAASAGLRQAELCPAGPAWSAVRAWER